MRVMFGKVVVALSALLVLGIVAAGAAQAAEGPFYKVAGARLGAGESKEITGKASKPYKMSLGARVITCTKQKFGSGAKIIGSTGANFGAGEEIIEFSECTVSGNGQPCKVQEPIKSEPLKAELAFLSSTRSGRLGTDFIPAKGTKFGTLMFNGAGCEFTNLQLTGSYTGEVWSGGKAVEVGVEAAEAKKNELNFPAKSIGKVWLESSGTLVETKTGLTANGIGFAWEGNTELELTSGSIWGIYTK